MTEKETRDMNAALFVNLVMMLGSMAMQQLGKLVDPATQKAHVDLQGAQAMIDMLSMIQDKTQGNLSDREAKLIKDTLSSLQLTYVEMVAESKETAETSADSESAAPAQEAKTEESDDKEPQSRVQGSSDSGEHHARFHKSYGE